MKTIFKKIPVSQIVAAGLLAAVFLQPVSALAEVRAGSVELTPFVGYNLFQRSQNLRDSLIYGGRLGYNFTNHFGLEGSVAFINSHVDNKNITGTKEGRYSASMDKVDLGFYGLDAVYHFLPEEKFTPFIFAGFGGVHSHPRISNKDMSVIDFGIGAKYQVAEHVALRFDLRDNMVSELFQEIRHNVNGTAGIVIAFGGTPYAAPAVEAPVCPACPTCVACPPPVVLKDTTAPYVTLTTPYNDAEGVPVHRQIYVSFSKAMDTATINTNTFTLYQGTTPVPGKVSAPSNAPASFTQVSDLKPNTNYTGRITTGATDLAGNPLKKDYVWNFKTAPTPEPVVITKTETKVKTKTVVVNKFVMLTGAHFAFDSAVITPAGKELIKQNIKIMKENPDVKVQIQGHTSASGSAKYNQALSERRANSVRDFVVKEGGIAPERVEAIGYGKTRPAVKETNPRNLRSKAALANMRVVFEIMEEK